MTAKMSETNKRGPSTANARGLKLQSSKLNIQPCEPRNNADCPDDVVASVASILSETSYGDNGSHRKSLLSVGKQNNKWPAIGWAINQWAGQVDDHGVVAESFDNLVRQCADDHDAIRVLTRLRDAIGAIKSGTPWPPEEGLVAPSYDEWQSQRAAMTWHWHGWIPSNQVVLVYGDPFAGKSTLVVDILRRITTGDRWPDGSRNDMDASRPVLYLDADARSDAIGETFKAGGGDTSKLRLCVLPDNIHSPLFLSSPTEWATLRKYIIGTRPSCIVIDTIAKASAINLNNPQELAAFFTPLQALTQEFSIPAIVLGHTNANGDAYGRHVQGSITSAWKVSVDAETKRRTLTCTHTRAATPDPITFDIDDNGCHDFVVIADVAGANTSEQVANAIRRVIETAGQALTQHKIVTKVLEMGIGSRSTVQRTLREQVAKGAITKTPIMTTDKNTNEEKSFDVYDVNGR